MLWAHAAACAESVNCLDAKRGATVDESIRQKVELLAQVPLFSGFSPCELEKLAGLCVEVCYAKGDTVCREGEEGDTFFVIVSGELEVWAGSAPRRLVSRLGAGDFVGEMTLLLGGARTATVEVSRRVTLLALDKGSFDRFFGRNPKALEALSRELCRRLVTTSRNEARARTTTSIGVISAPGLKGKSLVALALAGLLRDFTTRPVLLVSLDTAARARRSRARLPLLAEICRQSAESILGHATPNDGDPATLAVMVRASDTNQRLAEALSALVAKAGETFPFVVIDPSGAIAPVRDAIAETCDYLVEIVAHCEPGGLPPEQGARATRLPAMNLYNAASAAVPISHCLPFVIPADPALVDLDPVIRARRIRQDHWTPVARPLHRLARKILGTSVGVALGGGAAFGLAHVGVFKVLEENDVPVDMVAGCSMGSIVALAYAAGMRPAEMVDIARRIGTKWTTLSALDFTFTKPGILSGDRLVKIMSPLFGRAETFEHLRLPCRTVATDIESGTRVCIDSGRLDAAFRASCSVPMLWSPVRRGDQVLVDGAVIDPVPAEVVHEMGADVCIAVNVVPPLKRGVTTVLSRLYRSLNRLNPLSYLASSQDLPNMFDVIMNSLQTLQHELGNFKAISADVRINPDLSHLTWIEFYKPDELIERGRVAAEHAMPEIKRVLARKAALPAAASEAESAVPSGLAEPTPASLRDSAAPLHNGGAAAGEPPIAPRI